MLYSDMTEETTELEQKKAFAAMLLASPNDAFAIALKLFPNNTSRALRIAHEWPSDPEIKKSQEQLLGSKGDLGFLPGKGALAQKIWAKMDAAHFPDDFGKLAKLYAEVMGFIDKPAANSVNVAITQNKVMVIRDQGSNEDWENKAISQQRALQHASTSRH